MGIFHPDNNLGLEIFFIGVVAMAIFEFGFMVWIWHSNRKWKKKTVQKMEKMEQNWVCLVCKRPLRNHTKDELMKCAEQLLEYMPKRNCEQYYLCLTDVDWRPSHCENCHQYKPIEVKEKK